MKFHAWHAAAVLAFTQVTAGCLVLNTGGRTQGEVRFGWTFAGRGCTDASVESVQVSLTPRGAGGSSVAPFLVSCGQLSGTIGNVREGDYTLTLEGVNSGNIITYDAIRTLVVVGGSATDLGTVDLLPLQGSMVVDWQFERPGTDPTPDCTRAGVLDVEVELKDSLGTPVFNDIIPCSNGPAEVINLTPGTYSAQLWAYGVYNNLSVPLYDAAVNGIAVTREMPANLGQVLMPMNLNQFSTLDVSWTLPMGQTCAAAGLNSAPLTVVITRAGSTDVEDTFTADCTAASALRQQFVPGDWKVTITATDSGGMPWRGELTRNAAPGQTQAIAVPLQRI